MSVIYNTTNATSDLQISGNDLLTQIIDQLTALSGGTSESQELAAINSLISIVSTAANQDTANTTLASILSALSPLATAANQGTANTTLASILSALAPIATSAKQDTGNTTLASILSALSPISTAANQATANASLASIDSKMGSTVGTLSQVGQSTSSVSILPSNSSRHGFYLYNNSGMKCFVAFAATASSSAFTLLIAANSGYESSQLAVYKGAISAVWSGSGSGNMQITEMT